jgi:putative aminopeptidase FrvX
MARLSIDTDYLQQCLQRLLAIPRPTGYTDIIVREVCHEHRGARAVIAHFDTLGAQVKFIKENGRFELVPIGT